MRSTLDRLISIGGLLLAVALLVAGGLMLYANVFITNEVHDQLAAQKIFFPATGTDSLNSLPAADKSAVEQYAGQQLTNGAMADKAILCVGTAGGEHVAQLMQMIKKAGRAVVTSVAPMLGEDVKMNLFEFAMQRKELVGCIFGNANPQVDIPRLLSLYKAGKLKLDEINKGYQDMRDGKNFRGLIKY